MPPYIKLAHTLWKEKISKGDCVIDATLGQGKDAFVVASLLFPDKESYLLGIDIQEAAIEKSRQRLLNAFPESANQMIFLKQSHERFPPLPKAPKLIIYNLGYLPNGDHSITTQSASTLESLKEAINILKVGGLICITCYVGHSEGAKEAKNILEWIQDVAKNNLSKLSISKHEWIERTNCPFLILIEKL